MAKERAPKQRVDIFTKFKQTPTEYFPTGIIITDILMGGGLPKGSLVELCSPSGLGKSSLMAHISKNLCAAGHNVMWMDFEHALTPGLKEGVGLTEFDGNKFIHLEPVTYGDAEEILENLEPSEIPEVIVLDSVTAMLPDKLRGESILGENPGLKSRLESNFLIKYKGWARQKCITLVFINQMRTKIGINFNVTEDSAGGNALKFYSDVRLRMKKAGDIEKEEMTLEGRKKVAYGVNVLIWAIKNREVRSHIEMSLPIIFGKGVSNLLIIKSVLLGANLVTSAGSYFKVNVPGVVEGENVLGNKGLFEVIKKYYVEFSNYIRVNDLIFLVRPDDEKN